MPQPLDRYEVLKRILSQMGSAVVEGSNTDDDGDYRPGRRAIAELGVMSPLRDHTA